MAEKQTVRCAIYTRKSSEEGLEQEFNSLDAQREACEAYINSQKHEGWVTVRDGYDDGGYSGGNLDRPGLARLLDGVRANRINVIVVYKIDRLTRALSDFAKIVEVLDAQKASFVSVTQQFNTTTSMGRLTLNVLLSFAQFEREVTGERIRDKIAASKKKGMWMGGSPPLGYDVDDKKLIINKSEAQTVRHIFSRYLELKSAINLAGELARGGIRSKRRTSQSGRESGGAFFTHGALLHLLQNPVFIGKVRHKGVHHDGVHEAIVDQTHWEAVQKIVEENRVEKRIRRRTRLPSLFTGLIFDANGNRLTPTHAIKDGKRYRYYVARVPASARLNHSGYGWRLPAGELEVSIKSGLAGIFTTEDLICKLAGAQAFDPLARHALLCRARNLREQIENSSPIELREMLLDLVERIEIDDRSAVLHIKCKEARRRLNCELPDDVAIENPCISLPLDIRKRGVETRIVVRTDNPVSRTMDEPLVRSIAKGYAWLQELKSDSRTTLSAIAAREGVKRKHVARLIDLAFLAPDVVEAILSGSQPIDLSTDRLLKDIEIELAWPDQRRQLGFRG